MEATISDILCGTCHEPARAALSLCAPCATVYHLHCRPRRRLLPAQVADADHPRRAVAIASSQVIARPLQLP